MATKKKVEPEGRTLVHMRGGEVVGLAVMRDLSEVKANGWNPNRMDDFTRASLKHGLENDGWLSSQALLVWNTDEKGKQKDVIIDGEHRWAVATELGFPKGPMVMLDGLTEAKAKALTIKMNQKRGEFEQSSLAELLGSIQHEFSQEEMGLDLGLADDFVMRLLASPEQLLNDGSEHPKPPPGETEMPSGKMEHVKMVQLFFDEKQHGEFVKLVGKYAKEFGTPNVTDTVLEALRHVGSSDSAS